MVERDRCEEREIVALVQEWRGARWVNERDETQSVGVQMEEGWKILEGKEVKSYITSGSCEGKGRMESAEGRRDIQVEERGRKGMYEKQTKIKREREMKNLRKKGCTRWMDREQYSRDPTKRGMNDTREKEKEEEKEDYTD